MGNDSVVAEKPKGKKKTAKAGNSPDTRLNMSSMDVTEDRLSQLQALFPEAFSEGRVDFSKLKQALGEDVDSGPERYGLNWAGKRASFHNVQTLSTGTLRPVPEESVNFDSTENLIIEGDNLETLKLLQKSYYGKIKMIYIDPPYNTGNEFIYPDNFKEGLQTYLRYTKQVSEEGIAQTTNKETSGRFHSIWMNMMYPRLYLARNLLKDDGVIFVSIDDNEVGNLRSLMDEIFGGENFIASVIWQKVYAPKSSARFFSEDHDYVLVYSRNSEKWIPSLLPRTEEQDAVYKNADNDTRGLWRPNNLAARNYYSKGTYSIKCPGGRVISGPPSGSYWRMSEENFWKLDKDGRIWWGVDGNNIPAPKIFLSEVKQGRVPQTLWKYSDVGHTQEAKKELLKYIPFEETENVLNSVKPVRLLQRMLQIGTNSDTNDIVLDFFSGSGPTGHAVLKQNIEDGGNRRFIAVQLPEPLPKPEKNLLTIADMCKMRIQSVINEIEEKEKQGELQLNSSTNSFPLDKGFKTLRLDSSNFSLWDGEKAVDPGQMENQLRLYADHVKADRSSLDILYEILLKTGYPLTARVEEQSFGKLKAFNVEDGELVVCLADKLTQAGLREIIKAQPRQLICLDSAFQHNDQLKTNTVLESKTHGITFHTV